MAGPGGQPSPPSDYLKFEEQRPPGSLSLLSRRGTLVAATQRKQGGGDIGREHGAALPSTRALLALSTTCGIG